MTMPVGEVNKTVRMQTNYDFFTVLILNCMF